MAHTVPAHECKVLLSKKFGPKLIHRGYIYTVHKQRPNCVRWRCTQRNIQCRGSMSTNAIHQQTSARLLMPHNHVPDRQAVAATVAKSLQGYVDTGEEDSEQATAINRLENLGTAVKIKSKDTAEEDDAEEDEELEDVSDEDDRLFGQQVDTDTNWKPSTHHQGKGKGSKDKPVVTPVKPSPVKASKRIMEKKQLRKFEVTPLKAIKPKSARVSTSSRSSEPPVITPSDDGGGSYADDEEVCLRWNSHYNNMQASFPTLLAREQYVDVTLCSEGQSIRCHKLVLSACSPYFEELIAGMSPWQHPVVYLKGTPFWVLKTLVDFMYVGEVGIEQSRLAQVLEVGAELKIKGLVKPSSEPSPPTFSYLQMPPAKETPRNVSNCARQGPPVLRPIVPAPPQLTPAKAIDTPPPLVSVLKVKVKAEKVEDVVSTPPPLPPAPPAAPASAPASGGGSGSGSAKQKHNTKKTAPKRRASDDPPPLPEHLLFMRKGTRSRPLVKTPKMYDPDLYSRKTERLSTASTPRESPEGKAHHQTANTTTPAAASSVKQQPMEEADAPPPPALEAEASVVEDHIGLVQIKQEPIDIGETDVSFGDFLSEAHVLRFDEDEPGDEDNLINELNAAVNDNDDSGPDDGRVRAEAMEVVMPIIVKDVRCDRGDGGDTCASPDANKTVFE